MDKETKNKTSTKTPTNIEMLTEISKKLSSVNNRLIKIENKLGMDSDIDIDRLSFTELYSLREIARSIFTENHHHEGNIELVSQTRKLINKLNSKIESYIQKYNEKN